MRPTGGWKKLEEWMSQKNSESASREMHKLASRNLKLDVDTRDHTT